jgi:hypothetical protein
MQVQHKQASARRNARSTSLRVAGVLVAALAVVPWVGLGAASATPPSTTTTVTSDTQDISAKALNDHECNANEWHFVITQVDTEADAPASITVHWADGGSAVVPLWKYTGKTAHYLTTAHLDSTVTSATAVIYAGWSGQFNLSHGPCGSGPTPSQTPTQKPSETPSDTPSDTPSETASETPSDTPSDTPSETASQTPSDTPSETASQTPTDTPSETPSETPSKTPSATPSDTSSETPSVTPSETPSGTTSETPTATPTETPSGSPSESPSETPSVTPTVTPSHSPSASVSASESTTDGASPSTSVLGEKLAHTGGDGVGGALVLSLGLLAIGGVLVGYGQLSQRAARRH